MQKDSDANDRIPPVETSEAWTESYIDAGPPTAPLSEVLNVSRDVARDFEVQEIDAGLPQLAEVASSTFQAESEQLDVEALPASDAIDGGPAPAGPPEL